MKTYKQTGFIARLFTALFSIWLFGCISILPQTKIYNILHKGDERTFKVVIPETYNPQNPSSLVVVFHGGGGNMHNVEEMSRLTETATKFGFIVCYPNGTGRFKERLLTWNAGECCGYALENNVDDVGFIRKMVAKLTSEFNIDVKRIFATGMSNGGMLCFRIACELSDIFAAVAPVASSMTNFNCSPTEPISIIMFNGMKDKHVPYHGGIGEKALVKVEKKGVPEVVDFWKSKNKCPGEGTRIEKGNVISETYRNPENGTEVVLFTIKDGGHSWPGGTKGWIFGDEPSQEISASEIMLKFFEDHPKK
ncbi:MAG: prolyl oligopeptidase family serine peptidase [Ignavibacteriaceae bacterium]|nr:prolyl oligopeptidase family serine peptidase [Ignavibacteriaceae bacterium]